MPAIVRKSYFDHVIKTTAWKVKVANMFPMLITWGKIQEKNTANYNSLRKWIRLKVYSHAAKNVWVTSLTLILIFWWIKLVILRSHRKVYQNSIFNFGDIWKRQFVLYQTLISFFHTGKLFHTKFWYGREVIQWRILYVILP